VTGPRVLVATKFLPLPADNGGKLRAWATLRRLAGRARVTVAGFDDGTADVAGLEALGVRVLGAPWPPGRASLPEGLLRSGSATTARFWDRALAGRIRDAAVDERPDVVVVEYAQLLPWVRRLGAPRVVHASHNVESSLIASMAATRSAVARTLLTAEAGAVRRLERWLARHADTVSVVSERDRARLPRTSATVVVCPNGVDPGEVLPAGDEPLAVFVAQLAWAPNVDAATWLASEVWPLVRGRRPDARLALVGRDPSPAVQALTGDGIDVTGSVPSVRPWLARSAVGLAPLRAAGGSRLKILESLDAGRPVVATSLGAEGLEDLVGHGVVVADDPAGLATAIVDLLDDPARAARLGGEGHEAVAAHYGWDTTLAPLLEAVAPAGGNHAASS
jgi:glycosyltransferase involved in cell wall biosynthesis